MTIQLISRGNRGNVKQGNYEEDVSYICLYNLERRIFHSYCFEVVSSKSGSTNILHLYDGTLGISLLLNIGR